MPWLTLLLIVANLAAAFWATLDPTVIDRFGLRPGAFEATALFASVFLHANLIHLLGNMVFLAACGPSVELAAKPWRFGLAYLVGGVAGGLSHALMTGPASCYPLVGASGSVAAVIGYFAVQHHALRVPLAPGLRVPLAGVVGVWVGLQALGAFAQAGGGQGGVAFWAHLGGLLAGLTLSVVFRAPRLAQIRQGHEVMTEMNQRSPAALLAAAKRHLAVHPGDIRALQEVASAHRALGDRAQEAGALIDLARSADAALQATAIERLSALGALAALPSWERLRLAGALERRHRRAAILLLESVVAGAPDDAQRPDAMLALATLRSAEGAEEGGRVARALLAEYPLHPAAEVARARGLDR
jgi:membrane associated rhomboid family serine protease